MACRYTGVDTTWDRSLHIEGVANSTAEIVTSIRVSSLLGLFVLAIHIAMAFPLLMYAKAPCRDPPPALTAETGYRYIWYQQVIQLGTAMTIVADTLLSWTLLVQVRACACKAECAVFNSPAGRRHWG